MNRSELLKKKATLEQECRDIEDEIESQKMELALTESELETVVKQLAGKLGE